MFRNKSTNYLDFAICLSKNDKIMEYSEAKMFPAGFEPATLRVWDARDNHYTTETKIQLKLEMIEIRYFYLFKKVQKMEHQLELKLKFLQKNITTGGCHKVIEKTFTKQS